jgi:hypothetical protein
MTNLSPAALAVLDAFGNTSNGEYIEGVWIVNEQAMLAAALRAAVHQVKKHRCNHGVRWTRMQILAIADELDP